jgi:hypothetical protein
MKRRDLLEGSRLLRRYKMDSSDVAALGLATDFLQQKRAGEIAKTFPEWLDEEMEDEDDFEGEGPDDVDEGNTGDPTESSDSTTTKKTTTK